MKLKVQKKNGTLCVWSLLGELNVWVNGGDVLQKLIVVFCLSDDKGGIHIPKPQPRWMGG